MRHSVGWLCLCLICQTAGAHTPAEIVAAMKERRGSVQSVRYEIEATFHQMRISDPSRGVVETTQPPVTKVITLEFDLRRGWMFQEVRGEEYVHKKGGETVLKQIHGCATFHDGVFQTVRWPDEGVSGVGVDAGRAADFAEMSGYLSSQAFAFEWWPLFTHVGLMPLTSRQTLIPGKFHEAGPETEDEDLLLVGKTPASSGRKRFERQMVAKSRGGGPRLDFEVDARLPARVLSLSRDWGPSLFETIDCKYNGDDLQGWEMRSKVQGKPYYNSNFKVISCKLNETIDHSKYNLKPSTGMIVQHINKPGDNKQNVAESFRVNDHGGLEKIASPYDTPPQADSRLWWLCAAGGLLAAGTVFFIVIRRRRRAGRMPPKETH